VNQVSVSRKTGFKKKRATAVIILRSVPKGYSWGWFSREDARMHLRTVDSKNFDRYKVWLENNGKRVLEPVGSFPAKLLKPLQAEVKKLRRHIEGRWVNFMIAQKWLKLHMHGTLITVTAYPQVPGSRFTRTVDLVEWLPGIYHPDSKMWPKEPIKPDEIVLSDELPAIEIYPQKDESLRHHFFLPTILWED
jgi:hypothetical protein